jgi:hypothetical protein
LPGLLNPHHPIIRYQTKVFHYFISFDFSIADLKKMTKRS